MLRAVQMMRQLLGHEALPWEPQTEGGGPGVAPLPALHGAVLRLLERDPERRMSVAAFAATCRRLTRPTASTPT